MASILYSLGAALFLTILLFGNPTFAADSPSPSPNSPSGGISAPPESPSPTAAPPPLSPPASPVPDLAPSSPSPAPSPEEYDGEPADEVDFPYLAPDVAADVSHENSGGDLERKDGSGGMKGGQKAGVAIGVVSAACIVGLGAVVYKKRQRNIRRSQYSYAARSDTL